MKNILLLAHEDAGQESRLQVALDVTRVLDGHLHCLEVMAFPMVASDYFGSGADAIVMAEVREQAAVNRKQLERRLAIEDVSWSVGEAFGTVVDALEHASDYADLIVMSSREEKKAKRGNPERLPLKADRPILAVPPDCKSLQATGRALIAWDRTKPCNQAVRAAIPLLKCASEVELLEVNNPEGAFAMSEVATYLSRHGISTDLVERSTDDSVTDIILDHAAHRKADFIVMGAYSVPQVAEAVFGGVTRSMLLNANVPLLVAH